MRFFRWLWMLAVISASTLGVFQIVHNPARIDTNILHMLPSNQDAAPMERRVNILLDAVSSEVLFLVGHSHQDSATIASDLLSKAMASSHLLQNISYRNGKALEKEFWSLYFPSRNALLTRTELQYLKQPPADAANAFAMQTSSLLNSPFGGQLANLLNQDPLLLFPSFLASFQNKRQGMDYDDGVLRIQHDSSHYVLIRAQLIGNPYQTEIQDGVSELWKNAQDSISAHVSNAKYLVTGTVFYARQGRVLAQREMSLIGSISMGAVLILFLIVFRGFRQLAAGLLPIFAGIGMAISVSLLLWHQIFILTLVMGISLVGICVDYSFHYLIAASSKNTTPPIQRIFRGLTLGMFTTITAYGSLALSGFPGLIQMAVFSSVGVMASYATVLLWFPTLIPAGATPLHGVVAMRNILNQGFIWLNKPIAKKLLVIVVVFSLAGIVFKMKPQDDIRMFQSADPTLQHMDQQIQKMLTRFEGSRLFIVRGKAPEEVLQAQEELLAKLRNAQDSQWLEGYHAIAEFLPSQATQQQNWERIRRWGSDSNAWSQYANQIGLDSGYRNALLTDLTYLSLQAFQKSSISALAPKLWQFSEDEWISPILLQGVKNIKKLRTLGIPGHAEYVDRVEDVSTLFSRYRTKALGLLVISNCLILVLLCYKYGLRGGIQAMLPPLLSVVVTLGLLAWLGIPLQFFTILALNLVLGIGVDYTIFMCEDAEEELHTTWVAITLSAFTTILSFGLLAFSSTAAIANFGLTVLFGCILCFALAPFGVRKRMENDLD